MRVKLFRIKIGSIVYMYMVHFNLFLSYAAGLSNNFSYTTWQSVASTLVFRPFCKKLYFMIYQTVHMILLQLCL